MGGTLDLDAAWFHKNGPGALICPGLAKMCAKYPGVFEFVIGGCFASSGKLPGCSAASPAPGESADNAVFMMRSLKPETITVKAAIAEFGLVSYHDYVFQSRQGLNSLRQVRGVI